MKFRYKEELELMTSIETKSWVSVNNLEEEIEKAIIDTSVLIASESIDNSKFIPLHSQFPTLLCYLSHIRNPVSGIRHPISPN